MAKLHRLVKADDRTGSHVFTFLLQSNVGTESGKDVISSEFWCGYHKWAISLVTQDKFVGAFLTLKNASPGLSCTLDYGFTLLNRAHYAQNESFLEKDAAFTADRPCQGRKAFVAVADMRNASRGFALDKGEFLLELYAANFRTSFEYPLTLPLTEKDRAKYPPGDVKLETAHFQFGGSEWNAVLRVVERSHQDPRSGSSVTLRRLSNYDHFSNYRYRIHIFNSDPPGPMQQQAARNVSSDAMESLFVDADTQDKLVLPTNIYKLANIKGQIGIRVECLSASAITLLQIPMDRNRHRALRCYDKDKQAWLFEAHMKSDRLKFYLFYGDVSMVPRGCSRMVNYGVSVIPAYGSVKRVPAVGSPYTRYYVQSEQDDFGAEITTPVMMKDIVDTRSVYVYESTNTLTVQIEWGENYTLTTPEYLATDDIPRLHKMQMEKEIRLLQTENLTLEKQIHSYQLSIAVNHSKGLYEVEEVNTPHGVQTTAAAAIDGVGRPRSRSVDPSSSNAPYYSPATERRRVARRNAGGGAGVEYAAATGEQPHVDHQRMRSDPYRGGGGRSEDYRSDSGYRSDSVVGTTSSSLGPQHGGGGVDYYADDPRTASRERSRRPGSSGGGAGSGGQPSRSHRPSDARSDGGDSGGDRQTRYDKYSDGYPQPKAPKGRGQHGSSYEDDGRQQQPADYGQFNGGGARSDYGGPSPRYDYKSGGSGGGGDYAAPGGRYDSGGGGGQQSARGDPSKLDYSPAPPGVRESAPKAGGGDYPPGGEPVDPYRGGRREATHKHERTAPMSASMAAAADKMPKSRREYAERELAD